MKLSFFNNTLYAEGLTEKKEELGRLRWWYQWDTPKIAAEIVAAVNFCLKHNIDPSNPNWLAEHDAEVCRLQREACAAGFNEFDWEAIGVLGKCGLREYVPKKILATPAPEAKETE